MNFQDVIARLLPGVRSVRLNPMAGSMVLEYDPKKLEIGRASCRERV